MNELEKIALITRELFRDWESRMHIDLRSYLPEEMKPANFGDYESSWHY